MSEVTVQAQSNVLGLVHGQVVTVERTDLVDAHIASGHLVDVSPAPTPAQQPEPTPAAEPKAAEPKPDPVP